MQEAEAGREVNPIVEEVIMAVFEDLYPGHGGDPDSARLEYQDKSNMEILEASPLIDGLGGVQLVKELADAISEVPLMLILAGGPRAIPAAIRAGIATGITAGAVLARRADAANAELPPVE